MRFLWIVIYAVQFNWLTESWFISDFHYLPFLCFKESFSLSFSLSLSLYAQTPSVNYLLSITIIFLNAHSRPSVKLLLQICPSFVRFQNPIFFRLLMHLNVFFTNKTYNISRIPFYHRVGNHFFTKSGANTWNWKRIKNLGCLSEQLWYLLKAALSSISLTLLFEVFQLNWYIQCCYKGTKLRKVIFFMWQNGETCLQNQLLTSQIDQMFIILCWLSFERQLFFSRRASFIKQVSNWLNIFFDLFVCQCANFTPQMN